MSDIVGNPEDRFSHDAFISKCRLLILYVLFVLRLNYPVNNFFSHVGTEPPLPQYNQYFRGVKYLAQGNNMVEVGFESLTSRYRVKHTTTEPPHSPSLLIASAAEQAGSSLVSS